MGSGSERMIIGALRAEVAIGVYCAMIDIWRLIWQNIIIIMIND